MPKQRTYHAPGNDPIDTWAGAVEVNDLMHEAMLREGRTPSAPSTKPGTDTPQRRGAPTMIGSGCSSASGWDVRN